MRRRDFLWQSSAWGLLVSSRPGTAAALAEIPATFVFVTDRPGKCAYASHTVRISPGAFLPPSWHAGLRVRSVLAALGAANALLLMESLRDVRAHILDVRRTGDVELIAAVAAVSRR
jgi:hypothetical protein